MHLKLSEQELVLLGTRVWEDYQGCLSDHRDRMERFRRYYQKWRNRTAPPAADKKDNPNFSVPLLQWHTYAKWATEMNALLGDDAEIAAVPTGPSDQRVVAKIGRYMTWRLFSSMAITNALTVFEFRKLLFGRSHAYTPWEQDIYQTPEGEEIWYDGPGFHPLWPDDLIVPAEGVSNIQEFSFVIRKYRVTPQQLLDGERQGKYFGITEDFQRIVNYAREGKEREGEGEEIQTEKDLAEGVTYEGSQVRRNSLRCFEWYGKWRLPKGEGGAGEDDIDRRGLNETDLVIRYLPDLEKIVGVMDLMDLYPRLRHRRPFVEASLVKDGSYWSPGFGELLEFIEDEATQNHRLFTKAGWFSVGPVVFYDPASGFNPETFKYDACTAIPTQNAQGINVVRMQADLQYPIVKGQLIEGFGEKIVGQSDPTLGRTSDRPNQPRTMGGQMLLLEQGNIRASLDTLSLREDFGHLAAHIWLLDSQFAPESVFFRVTEEEAKGLFETSQGGAKMTAQERGGRYDFRIRFATTHWGREAAKDRALARYQLDLNNPLVVQNPRALWMVTNDAHKALGDDNFADLVPEPPDMGLPRRPVEEWTLCLQGEDFEVNPADNDDLHILDHTRRLREAAKDAQADQDAILRMATHITEHQQQKREKILMAALTERLAQQIGANSQDASGGGLNLRGPMPLPLQQLGAQLTDLTGGAAAPGGAGGAPGQV